MRNAELTWLREEDTGTGLREGLDPEPRTEMELNLAVSGMKCAGPLPPLPPTRVATRPVPSPVCK